MVVMLIVLVTLGTIAGLTVISVQGGAAQASAQRFSAMALYAAESGAAAAMTWLKTQYHPTGHFTDVLNQTPSGIPGNAIQPGQTGNLLSNDQQGWYEVKILNNVGDKDFDLGSDFDSTIVIQSTGYGPNGAMRRLEWEVHMMGPPTNKLLIVGWRDAF
jgi:type II secretory pathway pseudopilin PulG